MMFLHIWYPDSSKNNKYGHAAILTRKYNISVFPKDKLSEEHFLYVLFGVGVESELVFHYDMDYHLMSKQLPKVYRLVNISEDAVHKVYEKFLKHNNINPNDVTIKKAEDLAKSEKFPLTDLQKTQYSVAPSFNLTGIILKQAEENFLTKKNLLT